MQGICESICDPTRKINRDETNLSAIQYTTEEDPWFPGSDENPGRETRTSETTEARKKTNRRITAKACGFPKEYRLLKPEKFKEVYETGKKLVNSEFVIYISLERDDTRLGVATSRKIGPATVRNRLRRIVREIFRLNRARIVPGTWIVTIPRRAAREIDCNRGETSFLGLLKDGGALID